MYECNDKCVKKLTGKPKGKKPLRKTGCGWEGNIKIILEKQD
jgi:hypothetical protein